MSELQSDRRVYRVVTDIEIIGDRIPPTLEAVVKRQAIVGAALMHGGIAKANGEFTVKMDHRGIKCIEQGGRPWGDINARVRAREAAESATSPPSSP